MNSVHSLSHSSRKVLNKFPLATCKVGDFVLVNLPQLSAMYRQHDKFITDNVQCHHQEYGTEGLFILLSECQVKLRCVCGQMSTGEFFFLFVYTAYMMRS